MQAAARIPAHSGQGKFFPVGAAETIIALIILEVFPAKFYARMRIVLHWTDKKGNTMFSQRQGILSSAADILLPYRACYPSVHFVSLWGVTLAFLRPPV